jgi:hypothetical protein
MVNGKFKGIATITGMITPTLLVFVFTFEDQLCGKQSPQ